MPSVSHRNLFCKFVIYVHKGCLLKVICDWMIPFSNSYHQSLSHFQRMKYLIHNKHKCKQKILVMNMFNYNVILCPIFYKSTFFHLHKPHTLWEDSTVVYYAVTNCKSTIQSFYKYLNFQFTQISKPVIFSTSVQTDNRVKILLKCECMIRPTIAIFSTSVDFMFNFLG